MGIESSKKQDTKVAYFLSFESYHFLVISYIILYLNVHCDRLTAQNICINRFN
jgi:hypothetical protein